ncbi:MAG: MBL fold metallo-hydrolase [Candidatus Hydrogenedentes bacterium]|nr:MBL fold metallo-hydrolase [Candidatus Hydrogenedentota bacterium]
MLRFVLLGSSSSGNALLIFNETTHILIDNGFSYKRLALAMEQIGMSPDILDAVLITHEHTDHVRGLGVLSRRTEVPVFMTELCAEALPDYIGEIKNQVYFESGDTLHFNNLAVTSYAVSHDAADPVNYVVKCNNLSLGLATDFGHCSQLSKARLRGLNALIIESNYCPELLRQGPYPPKVQQRIRSRTGHLSNLDVQMLLEHIRHESLHLVILAHISRDNNNPELACTLAREALKGMEVHIEAAPSDRVSPIYEVKP